MVKLSFIVENAYEYMYILFNIAMQMWTLARFLPLVIGHLIPEDDVHWENFLCLLDIMDILFSRKVSTDAFGHLEALISDHHTTFLELYPGVRITMKMHSLVHMPRLMMEYVM